MHYSSESGASLHPVVQLFIQTCFTLLLWFLWMEVGIVYLDGLKGKGNYIGIVIRTSEGRKIIMVKIELRQTR